MSEHNYSNLQRVLDNAATKDQDEMVAPEAHVGTRGILSHASHC